MMIRTLALLVPVTITPLLAVETVESVMIRGPLSHIDMTLQAATSDPAADRSEVIPGLSLIPASADADGGATGGFDLLHALRF